MYGLFKNPLSIEIYHHIIELALTKNDDALLMQLPKLGALINTLQGDKQSMIMVIFIINILLISIKATRSTVSCRI